MYRLFLGQDSKIVIQIYHRKRAMEIVKMRGMSFDRRIVEFDIVKNKGFVVHPDRTLKGDFVLT